MTAEVNKSLIKWQEFFEPFKALAHMLHYRHLRKRLLNTCIHDTPNAWMACLFKTGVPHPAEWRWNIIVSTLSQIVPLHTALPKVWDPQRYVRGAGCQH